MKNSNPTTKTTGSAPRPDSPIWRYKLRRYRRMQAFGGFFLACTIFLPAVNSCNSDITPIAFTIECYMESSPSPADFVFGTAILTPYIFGLLVFIACLRNPLTDGGVRKPFSNRHIIPLTVLFLPFLLLFVQLLLDPPNRFELLAWIALLSIYFVFWFKTTRIGHGGELCLRFFYTAAFTIWFSNFIATENSLWGLWISTAGCVIIICYTFLEGKLRSGRRFHQTLSGFLTTRLRMIDTTEPSCVKCDYSLIGLNSNRCPECGTPF